MHWNIFIFRLFHYLQIVVQYAEKNNAIVSILSCVCFVFWEFTHGFWILWEKSQHWRTVTVSDLPEKKTKTDIFECLWTLSEELQSDENVFYGWHSWAVEVWIWRPHAHTHTTQTKSSVPVWVALSGAKVIGVHPGKKKNVLWVSEKHFLYKLHISII